MKTGAVKILARYHEDLELIVWATREKRCEAEIVQYRHDRSGVHWTLAGVDADDHDEDGARVWFCGARPFDPSVNAADFMELLADGYRLVTVLRGFTAQTLTTEKEAR